MTMTVVSGEASLKTDRTSPRNVVYYISVHTAEKTKSV